MPADDLPERPDNDTFVRIILDEPLPQDAKLGFDAYARVLSDIILGSDSPFTIGIFGDWGTGKTTLMRMIQHRLARYAPGAAQAPPTVIPVWFDAWRYEHEQNLIAPLLGEILDAADQYTDQAPLAQLAQAAGALSRGLLRGSSLNLGVVQFSGEQSVEEYDNFVAGLKLPGSSEYREAYDALRSATQDFATPDTDIAPPNKFVVFIDDLDRCLPEAALQVLEATKVFLDFPGFVYVLGLNRDIVEKCILLKYCPEGTKLEDHPYGEALGEKYMQKIVQVPFSIPPGTTTEMAELVDAFADQGQLPDELQEHFEPVAQPDAEHANIYEQFDALELVPALDKRYELATHYLEQKPRELKRLLNAYIVSAAITDASIEAPPSDRHVRFNPDITLSLLVLRFLDEAVYNELVRSPETARKRLLMRAAEALGIAPSDETSMPRIQLGSRSSFGRSARDPDEGQEGAPAPFPAPQRAPEDISDGPDHPHTEVAQLLLHTRILEASPDHIHAHARATSATAEPEALAAPQAITLDEALQMLRSDDPQERREAPRLLAKIGDPRAIDPLIAALRDHDERVHYAAALALGEIGDARAVDPLLRTLGDDDEGVRFGAAAALAEIGDTRAVQPLMGSLSDDSALVRARVARALGQIGDARAVEALLAALRDDEAAVRLGAAWALGEIGDARGVDPLISALGDDHADVRYAAAWALARIGDARAVEPLIVALGDDVAGVREHAARALGRIGAPAEPALPRLGEMERDEPERYVREAAGEAIGNIKGALAAEASPPRPAHQ